MDKEKENNGKDNETKKTNEIEKTNETEEPKEEEPKEDIVKQYPEFENYINLCFKNLTEKKFYSVIRDIIVSNKFETENEKITVSTLLNDVLYEILHKLNIEDKTLRKKCLIKIPKKSKQKNEKYYKTYYQNNKDKIIEKNLKRYYKKKEII